MKTNQWVFSALAIIAVLVTLILSWEFAMKVLEHHLSGGFGETRQLMNPHKKKILGWTVSIALLTAVASIALASISKWKGSKVVIIFLATVVILIDLYTLIYFMSFNVGMVASPLS